jgi:hypothetical protein
MLIATLFVGRFGIAQTLRCACVLRYTYPAQFIRPCSPA